jgi:hypothetical protein
MRKGLLIAGAVLLLGALFWFIRFLSAVGPSVTLTLIVNASNQPSGAACFLLTNGYKRAILLTDLIVETNSPAGWRAFSHTVPTHPQRLATGETKDLVIGSPTNGGSWRLRVTYGADVEGPMLLVGKAAYAVSQHAWPGPGFGIMAGRNSCISQEMTR